MPHILTVPTRTPYLPNFPHENQNTPFEEHEVKRLQYMTLISNGDRGVGFAEGNWEEQVNGRSPCSAEARSSTTTPNPFRDSRRSALKMSMADYKNLKQGGARSSPRPSAATPEPRPSNDVMDRRPGQSRNTSGVSADVLMVRVPSYEGRGDVRQNGAIAVTFEPKAPGRDVER